MEGEESIGELTTNGQQETVTEALAQMRKRLLDLSAHNPLVSFKHGRSSRYVRIVNEYPNAITETLYNSGSLSFTPIPEPTEDELEQWKANGGEVKPKLPPVDAWARHLRLTISPDLPADTDTVTEPAESLSTPYYPSVLETRLANLYKLARASVEETGMNFLHMVVGFLEWYESPDSDKAHYAPLYTIPVALSKGSLDPRTNTYQYTLSLREEEVQFNASIAARLEEDFGFVLPDFLGSEGEEDWPDEYLAKIESKLVDRYSRWKVKRWGTIALLNFSRLLMYRDLDPNSWPEEEPLIEHPLVNTVISAAQEEQDRQESGTGGDSGAAAAASFLEEHAIDEMTNIHEDYPLVDVADSSQHSALIDALDGRNVVIQGPPGTGKSQTITNLIAAALQRGNTVLFVSEKLAALEVVQHRMEKLGLGDFCLELHSHNTKKVSVIESLKKRYESAFYDPPSLDSEVEHHANLLQQLKEHSELVSKLWRQTGKTIHEILVRCVRFRNEIPSGWHDLRIEGLSGETWTPSHHAMVERDLRALSKHMLEMSKEIGQQPIAVAHPWRGIQSPDLDRNDQSRILEALAAWKQALEAVIAQVKASPASLFQAEQSMREMKHDLEAVMAAPPAEGVDWEVINELHNGGLKEVDALLDQAKAAHQSMEKLGSLSLQELEHCESLSEAHDGIHCLLRSRLSPATPLKVFPELAQRADTILTVSQKWSGYLTEFEAYASERVPSHFRSGSLSLATLNEMLSIISISDPLLQAGDLDLRNETLLPRNLGDAYAWFEEMLQQLQSDRAALRQVFVWDKVPRGDALITLRQNLDESSTIKRLLKGSYRRAKKSLRTILHPEASLEDAEVLAQLDALANYQAAEEAFLAEEDWKGLLKGLYQGVDTDLERVTAVVQWHATVEEAYTDSGGGLFDEPQLSDMGRWLIAADRKLLEGLRRFWDVGLADDIPKLENALQIVATHCKNQALPEKAILDGDDDEQWPKFLKKLQEDLKQLEQPLAATQLTENTSLDDAASALDAYQDIRNRWSEIQVAYSGLNQRLFSGNLPDQPLPAEDVETKVRRTRDWCRWMEAEGTPRELVDEILAAKNASFINELGTWAKQSTPLFEGERSRFEAFDTLVSCQGEEWSRDRSPQQLESRIAEAEAGEKLLADYLSFLRLRGRLDAQGARALCQRLEEAGLDIEDPTPILEHAVHASLADEMLSEVTELRRFSGMIQSETQRDFRKSDKRLLKGMRKRAASAIADRPIDPGYRGARVSEYTGLELLKREMAKQKRHVPLRQLLIRAGAATQALKPCFMMGPRSVAQYLAPGAIRFDLLVIDEASQMRPSDALGAVARCSQMIVVGDSKQLAPSSFFDRLTSGDEDDEEQIEVAAAESILDAVAPVFQTRQLRWHYRSRHESLIAFSNLQFYDNRLMLFPSPHFGSEALGIRFNYLDEGVFENQVNMIEARAVADRVCELLSKDPTVSIGVATMNAKQRDLIDGLIENLGKESTAFGRALEANLSSPEPMFIKNLENVQGDERDIMIISCTYGKASGTTKVHQRFGPINRSDGWRRLNVLFTRSRSRMEIFSSMSTDDIVVGSSSSDGVKALKGMLHYAATNKLALEGPSGRPPDSDFEIAVAEALRRHGFETDCQVGVAGFFIDLAVKHPAKNDLYAIGIECDGASYHSGKSVRDRDRLRQEILESMGWEIHRIWSTDWFDNPERALKPILNELSRLRE